MTLPFKRESHRRERVEGLIKQEISRIILHELNDPRCGFCTVTRVSLSGDLKTANVYVSVLGTEVNQRTTLRGLSSARHFVEKRIFEELKLKKPPSIEFHLDHSIERSIKISQILREEGILETTNGFGETGKTDESTEAPDAQPEGQGIEEPE